MQAAGETNPDICAFNDLALVQLDPADAANVNPSIPHWGGPTGINTTGAATLSRVFSYGNSSLRLGLTLLSPKTGVNVTDDGSGWEHVITTVTPGIPGDSGSAVLDAQGRALGVISTLQVGVPGGVSNGVGDIWRELGYANAHVFGGGLQLALGTQPFNGGKLPLGI
jgi:S1-C subfamily serine protease